MTEALSHLVTALLGVISGVTLLLSYMVWRMLRSDGWDKSNATNALRLISHAVAHPEDFGHMYYTVLSAGGRTRLASRKAFPYLLQDEFSEVVKTRPTEQERKE